MESTTENDVISVGLNQPTLSPKGGEADGKQYLTSYYRKYYLANREKLLARSKQRYADAKLKGVPLENVVKEAVREAEEIFVIDDISVPNKTTIEKLKELFSSDVLQSKTNQSKADAAKII